MTQYTLSSSDPNTTLAFAGGKGANLAVLARAGFRVPPGFIVSTDAYREFLQLNQIESRILVLAQSISADEPEALDQVSADIRSLFEHGVMPIDIAEEIQDAYRDLGSETPMPTLPVAVRSSATAEDLPGMAFAGQQDTYLNIVGETAVVDSVQRCWGSLWTARAMAYRARNHIPPDEVALAVVVQQVIASEVSGVLFTANPVTGRRDEIVIDASFGLGEAIVSGQVEPDHYVVDPHTWRITECQLGAKEMAILPREGGGTERITREGVGQQALADAHIIELAHLGQHVADHFGSPQDIEWAWAKQRLYLLQSRPVTSLYPLPDNVKPDEGLRVYVNFNSIQGVTDPLTPMGIDAIRLLFGNVPGMLGASSSIRHFLPEAGGRLFMDLTDPLRDPRLKKTVPNLLADTDPAAQQILTRLVEQRPMPSKRVLTMGRAFRLLLTLLPILRRVIGAMLAPGNVYPRVIAMADAFTAQAQAHADGAHDLKDRLRAMETDLSRAEETFLPVMPTVLPVLSAIPLLDRWLTGWLGEKPGVAFQLARGSKNLTTEMDLSLWQVAQAIRSDPIARDTMRAKSAAELVKAYRQGRLPTTAQSALDDFMRAYGMRAVAEIDMGRPRWREDSMPILQTLQSYLEIKDPSQAPDLVFRHNQERAETLAAKYIARARRTRWGWLRARLIGAIVRRIRALSGLREVPLFYMVKTLDIYRTALLKSGRELVERGVLEHPEDIFFIPLDSLTRFAQGEKVNLKSMAAEAHADYDRECARKQMPRVLLSNGEAFYEGVQDATAAKDELVGQAVSPGVAEGRAHVILDPHRARLEPGEILVCPSTDPGWTPLFLAAAGLVMEIGGMVTHGSVVAREYGLPAVVGVHQATTRLKTGDRIRVDGSRGRVMVLTDGNGTTRSESKSD